MLDAEGKVKKSFSYIMMECRKVLNFKYAKMCYQLVEKKIVAFFCYRSMIIFLACKMIRSNKNTNTYILVNVNFK
jgi:hypothetical protein